MPSMALPRCDAVIPYPESRRKKKDKTVSTFLQGLVLAAAHLTQITTHYEKILLVDDCIVTSDGLSFATRHSTAKSDFHTT